MLPLTEALQVKNVKSYIIHSRRTKTKLMFGLKGKKKKKVNTDLVLANKGAVDSGAELPSEASPMLEVTNTEDQPGSSAVRTRIIPNNK
ncbi:hypothetical protein FQN60_018515, partial [Etheostoma spectabile]